MVFGNIFNKTKKENKEEIEEEAPSHLSLAMNVFSSDAKKRSSLFTRLCNEHNWNILPGRFGGEYNNDMLAYEEKDEELRLILGVKVIRLSEDGLQLDQHSMGDFIQFSKGWLDVVTYTLSLNTQTKQTSNLISEAIKLNKIKLIIMYLNTEKGDVGFVPITMLD